MPTLPVPDAALTERVATRLADVPGVARRPMFGMPGFFIGKRCFACVMGDGLSLKLGKPRSAALLEDDLGVFPLVVMDRTMGGWVVVPGDELDGLWDLVDEARAFVASGG